ncbi:MAG: hypothetical protein BWK75_06205 [Candidatus Altiarchaeales archaeon A3]|nr:MAG: hypothetical protein BWK75_06205 [Candidatus Altiarchaeales archaeon A3]
MKDNFEILFYLSAALSIIGVLILAYVSPLINPPLQQIEEISHADIEKNVYVEGTIEEIKKQKDKSTALKFYNTTTEIYLPKSIQINFKKEEKIRALGTVKIYQGELEITISDAKNIEIIEEEP